MRNTTQNPKAPGTQASVVHQVRELINLLKNSRLTEANLSSLSSEFMELSRLTDTKAHTGVSRTSRQFSDIFKFNVRNIPDDLPLILRTARRFLDSVLSRREFETETENP